MTNSPNTNIHDAAGKTERVPVLAVDLDGTLVKSDMLMESVLALVKRNPLHIFSVLWWVLKGKAHLKRQVGQRVKLDVSSLPYHVDLLIDLRDYREQGRELVLATAADARIAAQIAGYLQIFHQVMASDGVHNLSGETKRDRLIAAFGKKGFDYAGNSRKDLPVWAAARRAIVVNGGAGLQSAAARLTDVHKVFHGQRQVWRPYIQALRPHQWLKNTLVFVPLMVSHRMPSAALLAQACLAFVAFSVCASSVYVLNDLLDLSEDRRHPRKRRRPFASGDAPLLAGLFMAPALLGISIVLSLLLPSSFLSVLAVYYALTLLYSFYLKRVMMLDVMVLAGLFTVRMMAGSAATDIWPSHWLLAFSMFIFVSLALVKRYAELVIVRKEHGVNAGARGYKVRDRDLLASMGVACGFIAVLVLALYITSGEAKQFYGHAHIIWLACPLMFFWISYIWLIAHRGAMRDDPLVFALRDRTSYIVFILLAAIMIIAT